MNPLIALALFVVSVLLIAAVVQGGSTPAPRPKTRKRVQTGNKVNVNVNGRHARTITIKAHTRKVAY